MAGTKLERLARLWLLFYTFAKIATLVVGGGLAMLPVIEDTFVRKKRLISSEEVLDMVTMTQTVPGIIAVNASVYIGSKVAGVVGALVAMLGVILPSFTIILIIALLFPNLAPENRYWLGAFNGVRAAVTGLILVTAIRLARKTLVGGFELIFTVILVVLGLMGVNPGWLILGMMPIGIVHLALVESFKRRGAAGTEAKK